MSTRTQKVIKNTYISIVSYFIVAILNLIVRKVFLYTFSIELLGYEGMFSSTFALISIAEIGSGSVFTYLLYKSVSDNDYVESSILLSLLKKINIIIAFAILAISLIIMPFFNNIFIENKYASFIYISQALYVFLSYFISYRNLLYDVYQKQYFCVKINTIISIISAFLKIYILIYIKNYYYYYVISILLNLLSLILMNIYSKKQFNKITTVKINNNDFKKRGIFKKLKDSLVYKVSTVIYSAADGFIIPIVCGIAYNGYYMNYIIFTKMIESILAFFTSSMTSAIGNIIWREKEENIRIIYLGYDFLSFAIATICFVGFGNDLDTLIGFYLGEKYVMRKLLAFVISLNLYITCKSFCYCSFQNCIGHYNKLKKYTLQGALLNVIISIYLGYKIGVVGVLIATIIGNFFIQLGREKIVNDHFKFENKNTVIRKECIYLLIALIIYFICMLLTKNMDYTLTNFLLKILYCIIISLVIIVLCFFKSNRFKSFLSLTKPIFKKNNK